VNLSILAVLILSVGLGALIVITIAGLGTVKIYPIGIKGAGLLGELGANVTAPLTIIFP